MNKTEFNTCLSAIDAGNVAHDRIFEAVAGVHHIAIELFNQRNGTSRITDICDWMKGYSIPYSMFNVPGHLHRISFNGETQTLRATFDDYFRGEHDYETIEIPYAWVYDENIRTTLTAELDKLYAQFEAYRRAEDEKNEAEARSRYEELKAYYEGGETK